jgi:two-component system cell cycle sensor histidine kinase/response regulator CckA
MGNDPTISRPVPLPSPSLAEEILQAVQTIVVVGDGEGQIVYASPAIERVLGYGLDEVLGDGWWRVIRRRFGTADEARDRVARGARGEIPVGMEPYTSTLYTKSGEERWILWHDATGPGGLVIGVGNDVTRLHRAEEEIESKGRDFRAIFDGASDGMLILNSDWAYIDANAAAGRIFGITAEELIGKEQGRLLHSTVDTAELRAEAVAKGSITSETEFTLLDGQKRQVEYTINANFRPGHHLIIMHDITERRALELQLAQAQKLEAVGRLAGGVAHDFNNMLTAIRGYGDLLLKKFPEGGHRRYVDGILNASDRAAQTTQQLLAFSRRQVMQPRLLELNTAIRGLLELIRRIIGEDVELITLLSEDVGQVMADPGQLGQILMNLAVNARDAMPGGGKLIIETRSVFLDDEYVLKHIQVEAGDYAMLAVTDTGTGIPPEVRPHIFEPFFTTKPVGEGSGLGLSTVYGIVKQSGGYVWVYSEQGEGTTFKIYLPKPSVSSADTMNVSQLPRKILLIEDDELIRTLAATVLREKGHEVLEVEDGSGALELCQQSDRQIDLVITDIGAPGMSGEDLMGYFAVKYPKVAIIHMSGFSQRYLHDTHAVPMNSYFLAKPFTVQQLLERVQRALERSQGSSPD